MGPYGQHRGLKKNLENPHYLNSDQKVYSSAEGRHPTTKLKSQPWQVMKSMRKDFRKKRISKELDKHEQKYNGHKSTFLQKGLKFKIVTTIITTSKGKAAGDLICHFMQNVFSYI